VTRTRSHAGSIHPLVDALLTNSARELEQACRVKAPLPSLQTSKRSAAASMRGSCSSANEVNECRGLTQTSPRNSPARCRSAILHVRVFPGSPLRSTGVRLPTFVAGPARCLRTAIADLSPTGATCLPASSMGLRAVCQRSPVASRASCRPGARSLPFRALRAG